MNQTPPINRIAGPLRTRINRLAHSHGLQQETRLRAAMLERVQAARNGGATFDELAAMVGNVETELCRDYSNATLRDKGAAP